MRVAVIALAGVENVLVTLWLIYFALGGAFGTPHQAWYLELPLAFLLLPTGAVVSIILTWRQEANIALAIRGLLLLGLLANFFAFFVFGALSSGGV